MNWSWGEECFEEYIYMFTHPSNDAPVMTLRRARTWTGTGSFSAAVMLALVLLALSLSSASLAEPAAGSKPNVLFM